MEETHLTALALPEWKTFGSDSTPPPPPRALLCLEMLLIIEIASQGLPH